MAYVRRLEEQGDGYVRSRDLRSFQFEGVPTSLLAHMKGIRTVFPCAQFITVHSIALCLGFGLTL